MTIVMGIETSCDETGVGFVRDGVLLGDALASSMDEHARFGGVVPEIAARAHVQSMVPTVRAALTRAGISLGDVGAVAVTAGPGLATALHVGVAAAKAYALALGVPLYGVHHLAGHAAADTLEHGPLPDRSVALIVSGGHTSLLFVRDLVRTPLVHLSDTVDDAAGRGVRQGGPADRPALPRRAGHRPGGEATATRRRCASRGRSPDRTTRPSASRSPGSRPRWPATSRDAATRRVRDAGHRGQLPGGGGRRADRARLWWPAGSRTSTPW